MNLLPENGWMAFLVLRPFLEKVETQIEKQKPVKSEFLKSKIPFKVMRFGAETAGDGTRTPGDPSGISVYDDGWMGLVLNQLNVFTLQPASHQQASHSLKLLQVNTGQQNEPWRLSPSLTIDKPVQSPNLNWIWTDQISIKQTASICRSQSVRLTGSGQWAGSGGSGARTAFLAIIKHHNWICSYAGKPVVWISISMLSHKSYFQEHWALSAAKLILHDVLWGSVSSTERIFLHTRSSSQWERRSGPTFLQSLKKFSRNTFLVVYSWSNIWAKKSATSSAARLSFIFLPAHKHRPHLDASPGGRPAAERWDGSLTSSRFQKFFTDSEPNLRSSGIYRQNMFFFFHYFK